jgi:acyl-CoA thioester hydrolase
MRVERKSEETELTPPAVEFPKCTTVGEHTISIVPRYQETDQSGVIHHTVYPVWFEMGRTELLRVNGLAYSALERAGVYFVVAELTVKYRRPAIYDEELLLTTTCSRITNARVEHSYVLKRASTGVPLVEGTSVLACVDRQGRAQRMPEFMRPEDQTKD